MSEPLADLTGRTCLVTGATSGIGRAAAFALAGQGASLVLLARDAERGKATCDAIREETGNADVSLLLADLASQREIRRVDTPHGRVRVKIVWDGQGGFEASPEYDDCKRAARKTGAALREVVRAASDAARREVEAG